MVDHLIEKFEPIKSRALSVQLDVLDNIPWSNAPLLSTPIYLLDRWLLRAGFAEQRRPEVPGILRQTPASLTLPLTTAAATVAAFNNSNSI